jgi:hypothetical protein
MEILAGVSVFKLIQVILISGVKFFFAPLISIGYGFNYSQTVIFTTLGGIAGLVFFYFLSQWIIRQYYKYCPIVFSYFTGERVEKAKRILNCSEQPKKKFTKRNRFLINFRFKYGYLGLVCLTPVLLSIPIGAFLAQKYYSKKSNVLLHMSISVMLWSFGISSIFFLF